MCIFLKFDYVMFCVSNLYFKKLSKKKALEGGGGGGKGRVNYHISQTGLSHHDMDRLERLFYLIYDEKYPIFVTRME